MRKTNSKAKLTKQLSYILMPFVLPLCLIVLGVLMLVNETLITRIFLCLGILTALAGLVEVVIYASRRKYEVQMRFLIRGIVLLVIGAILIIIPAAVNKLIPALIGIFILTAGISGISNTISFRQQDPNIFIPMIFGITNCLLGIFILVYVLFINSNTGWNVIGILMIISGVLRILNEFLARIHVPQQGNVSEQKTVDVAFEAKDNNQSK